jgi:hypothetical protein
MSLIIPANSASAAGGYVVDNSCRFNDGDSADLSLTLGSLLDPRSLYTFSCWIKRGVLGTTQNLFVGTDGTYPTTFSISSANKLVFYDAGEDATFTSDALLRDCAAWYHLVCRVDTTQGSNADRVKFYINGVQATTTQTNAITQNGNISWGKAVAHYVGGRANYFDGYMAEVVLITSTSLDATSFGEFDEDSGIWKPIDVSELTFGTHGFYLDFEDSANLGNDANGGADWTENNLTAIDQTTDTPTNNFATLNPLHSIGAASELSQGNLEWDPTGHHRIISTIAPTSGKWYAEVKGIDNPDKFMAGVCYYPIPANGAISSFAFGQGVNGDVGRWINDFGVKADGQYGNNNSWSAYMATLESENNNIVGIYMDLDNYKLYFSKNGSLVSATGKDLTNNGEPYGFISVGEAGTFQWNFGQPSFAISSGNTDGEYGNFEYSTTITGDGTSKTFKALCTANLSEVLG